MSSLNEYLEKWDNPGEAEHTSRAAIFHRGTAAPRLYRDRCLTPSMA
jgi:hypothetical protein